MNSKSIKKRLMRRRDGGRAFFSILVPMKDLDVSPRPNDPDFASIGFEQVGAHLFAKDQRIFIDHINESEAHLYDSLYEYCYNGKTTYWDLFPYRDFTADDNFLDQLDLYIKLKLWTDQFSYKQYGENKKLSVFSNVAFHTWYVDAVGDNLKITYSIKWIYPSDKLIFCSSMSEAFKTYKKNNIKVKFCKK